MEFSVRSGQPIVIDVTKDDMEYELRVGLVIMDVIDTKEKSENGMPKFSVRANLALDVAEKKK